MPDRGVDLGVDLYKLLIVAKDNLPSVAGVYSEAGVRYRPHSRKPTARCGGPSISADHSPGAPSMGLATHCRSQGS